MSILAMFKKKESPEKIASMWYLRLSSPECRESDRLGFEKWRKEHPSNAREFARIERSLSFVDRQSSHPLFEGLISEVMAETEPKPGFWRGWVNNGWTGNSRIVIGTAMAGVVMVAVMTFMFSVSDQRSLKAYETATGERFTITLSDGSQVTLNTNSRLEVDFTEEQRLLTLLRGQAIFEVVKNKNRPFIVKAENQRIIAIGTSFDIWLDRDINAVKVVLVEGRVVVDEYFANAEQSKKQIIPSKRIELTTGERLVASARLPRVKEQIDIEKATSWRNGKVIFREEPLTNAVREINRYSAEKLRLADDPRLRKLRVSGIFNTGKINSFVYVLESTHGLETQRTGKRETTLIWKEE